MQSTRNIYAESITAGIMVGVGGTIYLSAPDKTVGAVFFAIGLLTICIYSLKLYTGAIGYLLNDRGTPWLRRLGRGAAIWIGNFLGASTYGVMLKMAKPELAAKAAAMCDIKLTQSLPYNLFMGFMCGMLMYLAVDIYKKQSGFGRFLGILFAVPVFILSGFEHSIANMFYFAVGLGRVVPTPEVWGFLLTVTAANTFGAWFLATQID